jgi:hypothetical protein
VYLKDIFSHFLYTLRHSIKWSRAGYVEPKESVEGYIQRDFFLQEEEQRLLADYPHLKTLKNQCKRMRYVENLNLMEALDFLKRQQTELPVFTEPVHVLEVGVKNWATLPALVAFCEQLTEQPLTYSGVELDPWRFFWDGYSRYDHAMTFCAPYPQAHFQAASVLDVTEPEADIIVIVLPFVLETPHVKWGLPKQLFSPENFFQHIITKLLKPGGILIIFNQGELEVLEQDRLLKPYAFASQFCEGVPQHFYPWRYRRFGWWLSKPLQ